MSSTTKYINAAGYECECIPFTATLPKTPADVARFVAASVRDVYLSIANPYKLVYHLDEPPKQPAAPGRRRWWSVTAWSGAAGGPAATEAAAVEAGPAQAAARATVPPIEIRVVTPADVVAIPAGLASIRTTPPLTARDKVASAKRKVARRAADWAARRAVERRARKEAAAARRLAKHQAKQAKHQAKKRVAPPKQAAAAPPRAGWRLLSGARVAPAPSVETPATPSPAVTPHAAAAALQAANARLEAQVAALLAANARLGAQVAALQAEKAGLALRVETLTAQLARAQSDAGADAAAAVRRIDALLYRRVPRTEGAPAAAIAAAARAAAALRADVEAAKAAGKG